MASNNTIEVNPNGVYMLYDKSNSRNVEEMKEVLPQLIYINELPHKEERDKMFIAVLPKDFYDNTSPEDLLSKYNVAIRRYRIDDKMKQTRPKTGTTYGFYVTSESEYKDFASALNQLFKQFESVNFINKDSYEILYPNPYPDGSMRKYAIINFKKNDKGIFPKVYIQKLKILLNNSAFQNVNFKLDWSAVNVKKDINKGNNKDKKEKVTQTVTVSS